MKRRQVIYLLTAATVAVTSLAGCGKSFESTSPTANFAATSAYSEAACTEADVTYCEEPAYSEYDYEEDCADTSAMDYEYPAEVGDTYYDTAYAATNSAAASKRAGAEGESYLNEIYGDEYDKDIPSTDNEEYSDLEEIGFKSAKRNPLSTFAADVDTASYSNMRRLLNYGYELDELPENSIRVEELINYFNYDYKGPKGKDPFGVTTVMSECPWNRKAQLLSIGLKTEDINFDKTPSSNLVFLIDVSGSMYDEDKLPLLQDAFCMLVDQLDDKDRVSIVTYAGEDSVVLKGAEGSEHKKIKKAIRDLEAGGSTNGSAGIETAYKLAEKYFIKGGNNRVILATDGDLNVGVTSVGGLEDLIEKEKETGVFLSVLGFGSGNIKDNRMEALADKGNGNYSFIDSEKEAKKVLVTELSANMLTVCKDVKFQVEFNPEVVKGYRLVGYANRVMKNKDFDDDTKDGGEIGAGHSVTAMYEIILKDDYDEDDDILDLNIRFKRPSEDESELLTYTVDFDSYKSRPGDDFKFQSAVAEFGLIASHSEYAGKSNLDDVLEILEDTDLNDEYKEEFYEMVSGLI